MTDYLILIDNRELKLKKYFEKYNNFEFKNLDIGDIIIKIKDEIVLIIERKTINDLYCSIKDGRYKEQKKRLLSNYSINKFLYLIENNIEECKSKFNTDIIYGTIINILIRDNIRILKTSNISETIKYIEILIKRLETKQEIFFENKDLSKDLSLTTDYASTIKLEKKKNMTPELCQITQLAQIPGLSINSSKAILEKYNKIKNLILEYEKLETESSKELLLVDIEIKSINNKKNKKIGKVLSKRIYEYLN